MAPNLYRHPKPVGPRERGHDEKCEFVDNHGPSCECDQDPGNVWGQAGRHKILHTMKLMGWKVNADLQRGLSWNRQFGPHCINLTRLKSGWQIRWDKQMSMTFMEEDGFGTITDALNYFWGWMAERMDESTQAFWEHGAMTSQLQQAGIEPRRLGVKPQQVPVTPGPLKHEVTALMDTRGLPNAEGHVYPPEVVKKAMDEYNEKLAKEGGANVEKE